MSRSTKAPHTVLAAARDDDKFKAVELRKRGSGVEMAWAKEMPTKEGNWSVFAERCGLAVDGKGGVSHNADGRSATVLGVDSTAVVFYTINAPKVGPEETATIVKMQAESLLPLPASQIEVAWRALPSTNGTVDVTIAAARRDYLRRFANDVRHFDPGTILPACEGLARSWQALFSQQDRPALVISINARNTQVCLVLEGQVARAAVLDIGMDELSVVETADVGASQSVEVVERFAQDMQAVLTSFGWSDASPWPMFVLSDGGERTERVVAALTEAGLHAKTAVPRVENLQMAAGLELKDIYAHRVPIGLGLMALDGGDTTLDLGRRINAEHEEKKVKSARYSTVLAGAVAAVVLVALVATCYLLDVAGAKKLDALVSQTEFEQARQHQVLLKTIARHRPDMLGLLTDINAGENNGVILNGFHFKKGQSVSVDGQAGNPEQMWKFQTNLLDQKHITDVEITSQSQDPKTKKIKFTMVFHYKGFTKKGAAL